MESSSSEEFTQDKFSNTQAHMFESINQFAGYPVKFKITVSVKAEFGN